MNKTLLRILCPVLMLASGLSLTLALSPATASDPRTKIVAPHHSNPRIESGLRAAAFYQALTPTPTPEPVSHPGSTDGIVILSIAIVLIILIPILLQRNMWKK